MLYQRQLKRLTFELIVVIIDDVEVLEGDPPGTLILVHPEDALEHLHHLLPVLVPHGGTREDAGDVVRTANILRSVVGVGRVRANRDGFIVLSELKWDEKLI